MPAQGTTTQRGAKSTPNPRDFTGVQKARAEAAVAEEIEQRAEELSVARQADATRKATEVVDYTKGGHQGPAQAQPAPPRHVHPDLREIEEGEVEVGPRDVEIRVNTRIEDMVFSHAVEHPEFDSDGKIVKHAVDKGLQFYTFEEGVRYKVPLALAQHLDEIGYLYH